ncbi:MAG: hypothetical protein AAGA54_26860 [Myxococcota bacterium]
MRTALSALALLVLAATGCQSQIGDACRRSTDCSLQGERTCDLSNRIAGQGECTIEGCGRNSCPDEAACVKTYGTDFLSVSCDPEREDIAVMAADGTVLPPRDDCQPHEVCLGEGLCADEVSARTSCRRKCSSDRDCRGGYECQLTGSRGVYHTPDPNEPDNLGQIRICQPVRE